MTKGTIAKEQDDGTSKRRASLVCQSDDSDQSIDLSSEEEYNYTSEYTSQHNKVHSKQLSGQFRGQDQNSDRFQEQESQPIKKQSISLSKEQT